jgi:hypothetical protein
MEYFIAIVVVFVVVYAFVNRGKGNASSSSVPTPAPVSTPVVADANNNGITSKAELKKLTKNQLFDLAERQSLKIKKSGTKAQVINEIHSQLK